MMEQIEHSNTHTIATPTKHPWEVLFKLGELSGKLDSVITMMGKTHERISTLEDRVDNMERDKAKIIGMVTVGAIVGAALMEHVVSVVMEALV